MIQAHQQVVLMVFWRILVNYGGLGGLEWERPEHPFQDVQVHLSVEAKLDMLLVEEILNHDLLVVYAIFYLE